MSRTPAPERGQLSVEMVILAPALLLLIVAVIAGGRYAIADQAVQSAAADAARSASLARTAGEATGNATGAAHASLANQNLHCATTPNVTVNDDAFSLAVGTPGTVSATVTCVVSLGDLAVPGIPGSFTLTKTMSSPLDTYRERAGR